MMIVQLFDMDRAWAKHFREMRRLGLYSGIAPELLAMMAIRTAFKAGYEAAQCLAEEEHSTGDIGKNTEEQPHM